MGHGIGVVVTVGYLSQSTLKTQWKPWMPSLSGRPQRANNMLFFSCVIMVGLPDGEVCKSKRLNHKKPKKSFCFWIIVEQLIFFLKISQISKATFSVYVIKRAWILSPFLFHSSTQNRHMHYIKSKSFSTRTTLFTIDLIFRSKTIKFIKFLNCFSQKRNMLVMLLYHRPDYSSLRAIVLFWKLQYVLHLKFYGES